MNAPTVSVITVVLNAHDLLLNTMQAVDGLAYPNIQHVIVDGGSVDGTVELLQSPRKVNVRSISQADSGIYDAMNRAIDMADGDYLWFLNAGDTPSDPHVLDQLLSSTDIDVLYGDTNLVDDSGKLLNVVSSPQLLSWRIMTKGMHVSHQSIVVRRAIAPLYDLRYRHIADQKWMVESLKRAKQIRHVGRPLSNYLMGGVSQRQFLKFLKEKIRYSFNEMPLGRAYIITARDLVGAARFYLSKNLNAARTLAKR